MQDFLGLSDMGSTSIVIEEPLYVFRKELTNTSCMLFLDLLVKYFVNCGGYIENVFCITSYRYATYGLLDVNNDVVFSFQFLYLLYLPL